MAEHYLNNLSRQSELQLAQALHDHADHYDIVLVDTPRAFDSRITFNAVEAADHICIVAEMAQSSLDALPGQLQLLREFERNLTGVIATKVDRRTKKGQTMPDQLRQAGYTVLGEVPISAAFTTVWESRQTPRAPPQRSSHPSLRPDRPDPHQPQVKESHTMSVRNPNVTIPSPDGQSAPPPAAPAVEPKARSTAKKATATKPKKKPAKKTTPRRKAAPAAKAQQAQTDGLFAELTADGEATPSASSTATTSTPAGRATRTTTSNSPWN